MGFNLSYDRYRLHTEIVGVHIDACGFRVYTIPSDTVLVVLRPGDGTGQVEVRWGLRRVHVMLEDLKTNGTFMWPEGAGANGDGQH